MKGSLHWCSEQVYDYFKNRLGIQSYDDQNSEMIADFDVNGCSAFWITAGNIQYASIGMNINCSSCGPMAVPVELHIVGHEFAHGIINSFNPGMRMAAKGTLVEAFCDIIGAMAYQYVTGTTTYYQLTTNTLGYGSGSTCYRPWDNPNYSQQSMPDTYKGYFWSCRDGIPDNLYNKYRNSSLITHWFYLLAEGGSGINDHGTKYNIAGVGINIAEKILFKTFTGQYLNPLPGDPETAPSYGEFRKATIEAAYDYYGTEVAESVYDAWRAVGIYSTEEFSLPNGNWIINDYQELKYPFDSRNAQIIVEDGGELVVKSFLNCAENSEIIIEPGGKLIVSGGYIRCDNMDIDFVDKNYYVDAIPKPIKVYVCEPFKGATQGYFYGIQILGNPNATQINESNQGVLFASNAIIEGAQNTLITIGDPIDNGKGGGIIKAYNTTFKNAEILVDFKPYQNFVPSTNVSIKNKSRFNKCTFFISEERERNYVPANQLFSLVRLNGVDGITFNGCTFRTDDDLPGGWSERGVGILSFNSGFIVKDFCPGTKIPCEQETIPSEFRQLYIGINALEFATPPSPITIKKALFDRSLRAIELDGVSSPLIAQNTFKNFAHGTYLHGCSDFLVRENTFELDAFGYRAVTSTASELPGSEIGYNTFLSGVSPGVTFSYLNSDVQLKCNDFSGHTALDILLGSRTFTDQGVCVSGEGANNRFNGSYDNTNFHINPQVNEPDGVINYSFFSKTGEQREPQNIYNGSSTDFFKLPCGIAGEEDQCIVSSSSTGIKFELMFGLKGYMDSLAHILDGGATNALADLINDTEVESDVLMDSLAGSDTLLSNQTLLNLIVERPNLADSLYFYLLTRNQPLSPIIYRALNHHNILSATLYDSLRTLEDTVSTYRSRIVRGMDSANVVMNRLYRDIAYTYRDNDSIHFLPAILDTSGLGTVDRAVRKVPLFLGLGLTDSVSQVLESPVFDYTYELNTLKTVYQNILDARNAYLDADSTIDTTYIPVLKALHDTSEARAGAIAEAFNGGFMGDSLYAEYYEEPVVGKRNMQEKPNQKIENKIPEGNPLIVPNPNEGTFDIITPTKDWRNLPFHIIDYSGRTVKAGVLSESNTSVAINKPGFYLLIIHNNLGNRYEKFVVQ